jgi:hypothetical protein
VSRRLPLGQPGTPDRKSRKRQEEEEWAAKSGPVIYGRTVTISPQQYEHEVIRAAAEEGCMRWFIDRMDIQPEPGTWRFQKGYDYTMEDGQVGHIPDMWIYTCEVVLSE